MKELSYFKLTKAEPQAALWAGLMLMLIIMLVAFTSQRAANSTGATPSTAAAQMNASRQQQNLFQTLQQAFAVEGQQGLVSVSKTRTHIQLVINARQLFPPHGTELSTTGRTALNRLTQGLKALPAASYQQIQIEVHAKHDGYNSLNYPHDIWEVSSGQTVSVLKYLAATTNLEPRLFSAHSYTDSPMLTVSRSEPKNVRDPQLAVNIFLVAR
jgi:flagellar motor protein MotB